MAQVLESNDLLFKAGFVRRNHMHRVLTSVASFTALLDAALCVGNYSALHISGQVEFCLTAGRSAPFWKVVNGAALASHFSVKENGMEVDSFMLRIVAVELKLNFNEASHRFLLQMPPSRKIGKSSEDAAREYTNAWRDLVVAEKEFQFAALNEAGGLVLPALPAKWPCLDNVDHMPCVLWIRLL